MTLPRHIVSTGLALASLCLCLYAVWYAGRTGLSRLYSVSAVKGTMFAGVPPDELVSAAEESSRLSELDPEAYRARGITTLAAGKPAEAAKEFAHATSLRPRHYLLWMDLGRALDQADDVPGAIKAFREAVQRAPFFAQPRWQLGNVLFRAEQYGQAFSELRRAIAADPTLLPISMEMAWAASRGDAMIFMKMVDPSNVSQRLIAGRFLAKHGKAREAVELFRNAGGIAEEDQRALIKELMKVRKYVEAYEVWASGRDVTDFANREVAVVTNGGFESRIARDDPGFGWQVNSEVATFRVSFDTATMRDGGRSLRLEWNGESNPASQLVTQIVLVKPNSSYRLTFSVLARGLTTGGLPVVVVSDASSTEYKVLGKSELISEREQEWSDYKVDFKTGEESNAILISLQRTTCAAAQCPIFGRLWLDSFLLRKN